MIAIQAILLVPLPVDELKGLLLSGSKGTVS